MKMRSGLESWAAPKLIESASKRTCARSFFICKSNENSRDKTTETESIFSNPLTSRHLRKLSNSQPAKVHAECVKFAHVTEHLCNKRTARNHGTLKANLMHPFVSGYERSCE